MRDTELPIPICCSLPSWTAIGVHAFHLTVFMECLFETAMRIICCDIDYFF